LSSIFLSQKVNISIYLNLISNREELFHNIQKGVLRIPASLSEEAKNLIVSLLNRNPSKRLGAGPDGADEIKKHAFFKDLDWQMAKEKKLNPPKIDVNMKYYAAVQNYVETTDENLKKVFDDYEEMDPDIYENRTVQGWSFV
jgi:serine/threonine protein kinase